MCKLEENVELYVSFFFFFFFFFLSLAVGGEVCHDVSLGVLSEVFTVCHKSMAPTVHDTEPKFSEMSCPFLSFPFLVFPLRVENLPSDEIVGHRTEEFPCVTTSLCVLSFRT